MEYWEKQYGRPQSRFRMFGLGRRLSFGVKWLIIINVAVFLIQSIAGPAAEEQLLGALALSPSHVFSKGYLWQLLTYAFLHGGTMHILFNMLMLYWFGRNIENVWGTKRFVLFYLGGVVFAGLIYSIVHALRPSLPCIGASGAVMAVMMVYALWWPNQIILVMLVFPMRIRTFIMILIVIETLSWLRPTGNVANMAHLGGLLYGYLVVRFNPFLAQFATRFQRGEREATADDEHRLDEILDKIRREGIASLDWQDRQFLKKMSRR